MEYYAIHAPVFTIEDDTVKQQIFLKNAYSIAMEERRGVVIPEETLACYRNIMKGSSGKLVSVIRNYYDNTLKGQKVCMAVNNNMIEILFEKDGKKKTVGWRMATEKAATFEYMKPLLENAVYAYSQENTDIRERGDVPRFHYFVNNANINGVDIPVKIQIRELNFPTGRENRYYTHGFIKNRGNASPVNGIIA